MCQGDNHEKIQTLNSYFIYLATHAFFFEICILRDYLAEFAGIIFRKFSINKTIKITNIGSLRKHLLNNARNSIELGEELFEITDKHNPKGWMAEMGAYRDLIVHSVPIEQTHRGFLMQRVIPIKNNDNLPAISFPIPHDPFSLASSRTKGISFNTLEEWLISLRHLEESCTLDALDYCSSIIGKLMDLALRIAAQSPLKPKRPNITDKDLLEPIKIIHN